MQVHESLLINGVLITPAFVSTARVAKAFSESAPMPFSIHCEMQSDSFSRSSTTPLLIIPVESEEVGAEIIKQLLDKKNEALKFQAQMKSDSEMLRKIWDKLVAIHGQP